MVDARYYFLSHFHMSGFLFLLTVKLSDFLFLAHRIIISEVLPRDRKSYLTHLTQAVT